MSEPVLAPKMKIPYQVVASLNGTPLALPSGASVSVVLKDTTLASLVPDATPAPGTIASGFIINAASQPTSDSPDEISASVSGANNPDGSPVDPAPPVAFIVQGSNPPPPPPTSKIQLVVTLGTPVSA